MSTQLWSTLENDLALFWKCEHLLSSLLSNKPTPNCMSLRNAYTYASKGNVKRFLRTLFVIANIRKHPKCPPSEQLSFGNLNSRILFTSKNKWSIITCNQYGKILKAWHWLKTRNLWGFTQTSNSQHRAYYFLQSSIIYVIYYLCIIHIWYFLLR